MSNDTPITLSDDSWGAVDRLIKGVELGRLTTEGSGEGNGQCLHWINVTEDISTSSGPYALMNVYKGVATIKNAETLEWEDQTGVVKVVGPRNNILYTGRRYLCSAAGSHGDPDIGSNPGLTDADFPQDEDGNDVFDLWVVCDPPQLYGTSFSPALSCDGAASGFEWNLAAPDGCGTFDALEDGDEGKRGAQPSVAVGVIGDGVTYAVWTLSFPAPAPTSGTINLVMDLSDYGPIAYNATAATIEGILPDCTVSGSVGGPFTITSTIFGARTLTVGLFSLSPKPSNLAFEFCGNDAVTFEAVCPIYPGDETDPSVVIAQTTATDGATTHDVWTITVSDAIDGSFTIFVDGVETVPLIWVPSTITNLAAATSGLASPPTVSGATMTFSADFDPHTVVLGDMSKMIGSRDYWFAAPAPFIKTVQVPTAWTCVDGDFVPTYTTITVVAT